MSPKPSTASHYAGPVYPPETLAKYDGRCYRKKERLACKGPKGQPRHRIVYGMVRGLHFFTVGRECYPGGVVWFGRLRLDANLVALRRPKGRERDEGDWNPVKKQTLLQFVGETIERMADTFDFDVGVLPT